MNYANLQNAVCFSNLKQAALYFDRVIPVSFRILRKTKEGIEFELPEKIPAYAFSHIVFGEDPPPTGRGEYRHVGKFMDEWDKFIKLISPSRPEPGVSSTVDDYADVQDMYLNNVVLQNGTSVREVFRAYAKSLGVDFASVLLDPAPTEEGYDYSVISLVNLPMIDTSRAEWGQIIELRKDRNARVKLRRLRLFLNENYEDRSQAFIEDDLLQRMDDYETTRKSHGFEAISSALGMLLDAKSLHVAGVGGLVATLFGGLAVGLSTTVVIELGQCSLEIARQKHKIREFERGHELAFLIHAKSVLK